MIKKEALQKMVTEIMLKHIHTMIGLYKAKHPEEADKFIERLQKALETVHNITLHPAKHKNGDPAPGGFYVVFLGYEWICKVSLHNHKLGKTASISKLAGSHCKHCKHCFKECYVLKSYRLYKDKIAADFNNSVLFDLLENFGYDAFIKAFAAWWKRRKRNTRFFRWDESGDLISVLEVLAQRQIALMFPGTRFYTYTKRKPLFEAYEEQKLMKRIDNYVIRFSPWLGDEENNPATISGRRGCGYYVIDADAETVKRTAESAGGVVCLCVGGNTKDACRRCGHACAYRNKAVFEQLNA